MTEKTSGVEGLSESLARMAGILLTDETLDTVLSLVVSLASATVRDVVGVSVTLADGGPVRTTQHTDEVVLALDRVQYDEDDGPCVEAVKTGVTVEGGLSAGNGRWPTFSRAAQEEGIGSVMSTPLTASEEVIGALNMYSRQTDTFGEDQRSIADLFARQASVVLANTVAYSSAARLNEQLREAVATREMIGQAKGIIMAQKRCNRDEAFDILRRASQRTNKKLRDIAADIVASVERASEDA